MLFDKIYYQNMLFLEAARMLKLQNPGRVLFVLVGYLPIPEMVGEMKTQLLKRDVPWLVKFVIQSDQPNIYDEFCKQVLETPNGNDKITDFLASL